MPHARAFVPSLVLVLALARAHVAYASTTTQCEKYRTDLSKLKDTGGDNGPSWLDTTEHPDTEDGSGKGNKEANDAIKYKTVYSKAVGVPDNEESAIWDLLLTSSDSVLNGDEKESPVSDKHNATLCCGTYTVEASKSGQTINWADSTSRNGAKWNSKSSATSVIFVAHEQQQFDGRLFDGNPLTGCSEWDSSRKMWSNKRGKCEAFKIKCDESSGVVTGIDLETASLGEKRTSVVPNSVGAFTNLVTLDLGDNSWKGVSSNIQKLTKLETLDLKDNSIHMSGDSLFGPLQELKALKKLNLPNNDLHGSLPNFGSKLTKLEVLDLSRNNLEGVLPDDTFQHLTHMQELKLESNKGLEGAIPSGMAEMSHARIIRFQNTGLGGQLFNLSRMSYLTELLASSSRLSGTVPQSIASATRLETLDLAHADVAGTLPAGMVNLRYLKKLHLQANKFSGTLPEGIFSKSYYLAEVDLSHNKLEGSLESFFNTIHKQSMATFTKLNAEENSFEGAIPPSVGNLTRIQELKLGKNRLSGIPSSIGKLSMCHTLDLHDNRMSGQFPNIAGMDRLKRLDIHDNSLEGSLGDLSSLCMLTHIHAESNRLTSIGKLPTSVFLADFDNNEIAQDMTSMGFDNTMCALETLSMERNKIKGDAASLGTLIGLRTLKVGFNSISGQFPKMGNRNLHHLELHDNRLSGAIDAFYCNNRAEGTGAKQCIISPSFDGKLCPILSQETVSIDTETALQKLYLDVSNNDLTSLPTCSNAPTWMKRDHATISINIANNKVQGPFQQTSSSLLPKLSELDATNNALGQGNTPDKLQWIAKMGSGLKAGNKPKSILLSNNSLSLAIDSFEDQIDRQVQFLDFSYNKLTGALHPFGRFTEMMLLNLKQNQISGTLDGLSGLWSAWHPVHNRSYAEICANEFNTCDSNSTCKQELSKSLDERKGYPTSGVGPQLLALAKCVESTDHTDHTVNEDYIDVFLANNQFSGTLDFLKNDHHNMHVKHLDLANNQLNGSVPHDIWRSDFKRLLLNNNKFTGPIPMLRPDCQHWMSSVANVRSSNSQSIASNWTAVKKKLLSISSNWCAINAPKTCKTVKDAAACDAECKANTAVLIPQKKVQNAGWFIWNDMCQTGLSFGPGIHTGKCQPCLRFSPSGCDSGSNKDDPKKCKCVAFGNPSQTCVNDCIKKLCKNVFQNDEYCELPAACYLEVSLGSNQWDCPAPLLPPGDNGGFTRELAPKAPFVNPVYTTAECTCPAGSTCTGDGRNKAIGRTPTGDECRAFCKPCLKGYFGANANADGCTACPAGQYTDDDGQTACSKCAAGRYGVKTAAVSEPAACGSCDPGKYQPNRGQSQCIPAPKGASAPYPQMNSTIPCEAGSFSNELGLAQCHYCSVGSWQNLTGSKSCQLCPKGTVTRMKGLTSLGYCNDDSKPSQYCPQGHFASKDTFVKTGKLECQPAPLGHYVVWKGVEGGVAWDQDKVLQKCGANSIATEKAATSCQACPVDTYANGPDENENANYICLPCGLLGSESDFCSPNYMSLLALVLCIVLLLAGTGYKAADTFCWANKGRQRENDSHKEMEEDEDGMTLAYDMPKDYYAPQLNSFENPVAQLGDDE